MGLISPWTAIKAVSLMHLVAAYFLLVNPQILANQNLVLILGGAMQVADPPTLLPSAATAVGALVLALLSISDLAAASLPVLPALSYWTAATPARLVILFPLTAYIYTTKEDGIFASSSLTSSSSSLGGGSAAVQSARAAAGYGADAGEMLRNSLVFGVAFLEVCTWFYIFLLLRDERQEVAVAEAKKEIEREEREKEKELYGF